MFSLGPLLINGCFLKVEACLPSSFLYGDSISRPLWLLGPVARQLFIYYYGILQHLEEKLAKTIWPFVSSTIWCQTTHILVACVENVLPWKERPAARQLMQECVLMHRGRNQWPKNIYKARQQKQPLGSFDKDQHVGFEAVWSHGKSREDALYLTMPPPVSHQLIVSLFVAPLNGESLTFSDLPLKSVTLRSVSDTPHIDAVNTHSCTQTHTSYYITQVGTLSVSSSRPGSPLGRKRKWLMPGRGQFACQ